MANKYSLMSDKSSLENLKENLKYASSDLIKAVNTSSKLSSIIDNHYLIDDSQTKLSIKADDIAKEIKETSEYLRNTILPEIDNRINEISREIKEIEEEERRQEEERRKASEITFWW